MSQNTIIESKILIVDDEPSNIEYLKEIMEITRITDVDSTTSAKLAFEKYASTHYDLVLLDINMPELSGFEVLERFAQLNKTNPAKVVMLSGHCDNAIKQKALKLGANDMLSKPFDIGSFINCVEKTLCIG